MQEDIILPNIIYTEVEVYDHSTRKKNSAMSYESDAFHVENQSEYERLSKLIKDEIKIWLSDKYKFFKKYKNDQLLLVDKQGRKYIAKVVKGRYIKQEDLDWYNRQL